MHILHNEILNNKDVPSVDGGRYSEIVNEILSLIDGYKSSALTETAYKLKLSNLRVKIDQEKLQYKPKVYGWLNELKKLGSEIKN